MKAMVTKAGYRNSTVASQDIYLFVASNPTFKLDGATLTINCSNPTDAEIYFSIGENTEPTTRYQTPITLTDNRVVRAMAKREGYKDSEIAEFREIHIACDAPELKDYDGHYFELTVPEGATAYYSFNDADPTEGEVYSGRTAVNGVGTLKVVARDPF